MVAFRGSGERNNAVGVGDTGEGYPRGYLVVRLGEEGFVSDLCGIGRGVVA